METLLYTLDKTAIAIAVAQCGAVIGLSIVTLIHYARHRSMAHIALVATSYILLTTLVAGAVVFQIFYSGWTRLAGIIIAMITFGLGDIAIWKVWHSRTHGMNEKELKEMNERLDRQSHRLQQIEQCLNEAKEVTLVTDGVVKVEIIAEKGDA